MLATGERKVNEVDVGIMLQSRDGRAVCMIQNIFTRSNIIWTLIFVAVFCGLVALERGDIKFPFMNFTPPTNNSEKYEILRHETYGDTEIYAILIRPGGKGEYATQSLQRNCKKSCAIDVYDDKNAFTQQKRYDAITKTRSADQAEVDDWFSKNRGFVKEHYVGWLDEKTREYYNYPLFEQGFKLGNFHSSFYHQ